MSKTFTILLTVLAVVFLVVVAPIFIKPHYSSAAAPCIIRLIQIDSAKQQWMIERGKSTNETPTWNDLYPYLASSFTNKWFTNGQPVCPEGGVYTLRQGGEPSTCSLGKQDPNHHAVPE